MNNANILWWKNREGLTRNEYNKRLFQRKVGK